MTLVPDARRRAIGEALLRIIAQEGLDAVSVRAVAQEAGTSLGMVQRHFSSKDDMLLFALRQASEMAAERIQRITFTSPVMATLRRVVDEFLPLDEQKISEARVYYAFVVKSATNREFAEIIREQDRNLQGIFVSILDTAAQEKEIPTGRDHHALARMLSSALDGFCLALLGAPKENPVAEITRSLDMVFDLISSPRPRGKK